MPRTVNITPSQITRLFYRSGALSRGVVTDVIVDVQFATTVSTLTFFRANYSRDAIPTPPCRLVLKRPLTIEGLPSEASRNELAFYSDLASELTSPPILPCYAAVWAGKRLGSCLVLEDLRTTHTNRPWPLPPTYDESLLAIRALAHIHANWWQDPALGIALGTPHTAQSLTTMVMGIAESLPGFIDAVGDAISTARREILERVFSSDLRPWLRLLDSHGRTITHGDAHGWNFLFPREKETSAYLIDWQLWHVDIGVRDLAFMMGLHWYPERRRAIEIPLLRRYLEYLSESGIDTYSWDQLWLDYRRCAVRNLTFPLILWKRGLPPEAWWHRLECAMAAFEELGCMDVL